MWLVATILGSSAWCTRVFPAVVPDMCCHGYESIPPATDATQWLLGIPSVVGGQIMLMGKPGRGH